MDPEEIIAAMHPSAQATRLQAGQERAGPWT